MLRRNDPNPQVDEWARLPPQVDGQIEDEQTYRCTSRSPSPHSPQCRRTFPPIATALPEATAAPLPPLCPASCTPPTRIHRLCVCGVLCALHRAAFGDRFEWEHHPGGYGYLLFEMRTPDYSVFPGFVVRRSGWRARACEPVHTRATKNTYVGSGVCGSSVESGSDLGLF